MAAAERPLDGGGGAEPEEERPSEGVDPMLLSILRCPISHGPLVLKEGMLLCYESRKAYRIEDGIPVMLAEEAVDIPEQEIPEEHRR